MTGDAVAAGSGWEIEVADQMIVAYCGEYGSLSIMTRYYFDVRIHDDVGEDEEGVNLPDLQAVQREAMRVLADVVRELIEFPVPMAVEVRDDIGPVMQVRVAVNISRTN